MRVLFIRHGQALSGALARDAEVINDDVDRLTTVGESEAKRLGDHLAREFKITRIFASPLIRARQTAEAVRSAIPTTPSLEIDDRLAERRFAFPAGTRMLEARRIQEKSHLVPEEKFSGGESRAEHRIRIVSFLAFLEENIVADASANREGDIAVVSHGGTIEHMFICLCGAPIEASAKMFVSCDTAHYHLWFPFQVENRLVWRLDAVDVAP